MVRNGRRPTQSINTSLWKKPRRDFSQGIRNVRHGCIAIFVFAGDILPKLIINAGWARIQKICRPFVLRCIVQCVYFVSVVYVCYAVVLRRFPVFFCKAGKGVGFRLRGTLVSRCFAAEKSSHSCCSSALLKCACTCEHGKFLNMVDHIALLLSPYPLSSFFERLPPPPPPCFMPRSSSTSWTAT